MEFLHTYHCDVEIFSVAFPNVAIIIYIPQPISHQSHVSENYIAE